jgi:spore germination protein Q
MSAAYYYQETNGYNGAPYKQQQQSGGYPQQQQGGGYPQQQQGGGYPQQQQGGGYSQQQQGGGYSQQNSVEEYMVPEEEWEREAVLDPAWERQQKKVFDC